MSDIKLNSVAQFAADMQLLTGEEWPTEFLKYVMRNKPEYVEQCSIDAGILRVMDPKQEVHLSVVADIRERRKELLDRHERNVKK